jgi:5'-nucleotidase / UDP-sugar diphosphatase
MKKQRLGVIALIGLTGVLAILPVSRASAQPPEAVRTEVEISTKEINAKENVLGAFVADAIRASAKADAAFIDASSFVDVGTLPKGNVSGANILKALESKSDSIVLVKLTGAQILKALEHSLYLYPKPNSGFLQFSGLTVTANPNAERETRVVSVKVGGDPLDPNKTYKVAMPAPLANGALGYFKIWKKSDIIEDTKKTLEAAVTATLREKKTLTKGDERLVIKK